MSIVLRGMIVPQQELELHIVYALEDDGYVQYRDHDSSYTNHYNGTLGDFVRSYNHAVVVPVDPMTAWRMDWISHDRALELMGFTDDVRAVIRMLPK